MDFSTLYTVAFVLIAVGVIIVVAVILVSTGKSRGTEKEGEGGGKVKGAGVIMIGPIPIIFGTDKKSVKTIVALGLALTVVLVIWYYLMWS